MHGLAKELSLAVLKLLKDKVGFQWRGTEQGLQDFLFRSFLASQLNSGSVATRPWLQTVHLSAQ